MQTLLIHFTEIHLNCLDNLSENDQYYLTNNMIALKRFRSDQTKLKFITYILYKVYVSDCKGIGITKIYLSTINYKISPSLRLMSSLT